MSKCLCHTRPHVPACPAYRDPSSGPRGSVARAQRAQRAIRAQSRPRCRDCGEIGQTTGHMGCQYPQDHP